MVSSINLQDTLIQQGLTSQMLPQAVLDMTGGYLNKFDALVMKLQGSTGKQWTPITTIKKEGWYMYKNYSTGVIASTPTVVGNNVTITWTDATNDSFIVGGVLSTSNMQVKGQVIAHAPGTVTVVPAEGTTIPQIIAEWTANVTLVSRYDASPIRNSSGRESQFYTPEYSFNCWSTIRVSEGWSAVDATLTKPFFLDTNKNAYRLYNDQFRMQLFFKSLFQSWRYSNRAHDETRNGQKYNSNGGIDWAILNRGGEVLPLASALTQSVFEAFAGRVWDKRANRTQPMVLLGGRNALNKVRDFYTANITASGILNTFGGVDVQGLNLNKVDVNGMSYVMIEDQFLNDQQLFPQLSTIPGMTQQTLKSNDLYILDMEPIMDKNRGVVPSAEMFYFGKSPFALGYIKGMTDADAVSEDMILESVNAGAYPVVTADDAASWHVIHRGGLDFGGAFYSGKITFIV